MNNAVWHGLAILESFSPENPTLDISEIAESIGLPWCETEKHADKLIKLGYLERDRSGEYRLAEHHWRTEMDENAPDGQQEPLQRSCGEAPREPRVNRLKKHRLASKYEGGTIPVARLPKRSVMYGVAVLACFSPERPSLNIREIAKMIGLPWGEAAEHAGNLIRLGYLEQDSLGEYRLVVQPPQTLLLVVSV